MNAQERLLALEGARRGDNQALGDLLQSFRPYIRAIVHAMKDERLQVRMDASDLIQDAMLEAHRSFSGFRGNSVGELAVWLRTIVVRTIGKVSRGYLGTSKRDPSREQAGEQLVYQAVDSGDSPSDQAIRHEEAARMAEALAGLPDDMQQVLLGRHVDGLSHAALAQRLGRTEAAVRMLYLRALRQLRGLYRG